MQFASVNAGTSVSETSMHTSLTTFYQTWLQYGSLYVSMYVMYQKCVSDFLWVALSIPAFSPQARIVKVVRTLPRSLTHVKLCNHKI